MILMVFFESAIVQTILKTIAHILFIAIALYSVRLLTLSNFFTVPMKIGGNDELFLTRYLPYLLDISLFLYLKKKNLFVVFLLMFIMFLVGRYMGVFLTFEEYVGKI